MAQSRQLQHRYIQGTALAYFPNGSVTTKDPDYIDGSNILTSQKGYVERRNGFSNYLSDTTFTFSGTIQRFFTWRRWTGASVTLSGSFFVMYNEINAASSKVYKQLVGTDVYPVLINTDSTSTGGFDFVVSNDFVFFSNGVDM